MANNINWGKIYDNTYWGSGVTNNTISWGKVYSDLSGGSVTPSFALDFDTISDDFTFTRNSFATRVNENGLIETVTNLGSEQVVNGDFSDGANNWTIEAVWTIQDGVASGNGANGSSQELTQSSVTTIGKTYKVTYDILNYVSGSVAVGSGDLQSGNGTITEYWVAVTSVLKIRGIGFFNGDVTNISIQEVIEDDIPRIDYSTGEGAFLLEPQSTNLIAYSEDFTQWNNINSSSSVSVSEKSPLNTYATILIENAVDNYHNKSIGIATTSNATFSVLAKKIDRDYLLLITQDDISSAAWFDLSDGSTTQVTGNWSNPEIQDMGSGWYLCSANYNGNSGSTFYLGASDSLSNVEYQGVLGKQALYLAYSQLEALDYATSYIPTEGSTITRSAETCLDGIVSANSLEGVLYWEGSSDSNSTMIMTELSQGDITNRVSTYIQSSDARGSIRINGSQKNLTGGGSLVTAKKLAVVWSNNIVSFWVNGSQIDTDTYVGSIPEGVLTDLNFAQVGGAAPFYGNTKDLRIYDKALTDEELTELTTI